MHLLDCFCYRFRIGHYPDHEPWHANQLHLLIWIRLCTRAATQLIRRTIVDSSRVVGSSSEGERLAREHADRSEQQQGRAPLQRKRPALRSPAQPPRRPRALAWLARAERQQRRDGRELVADHEAQHGAQVQLRPERGRELQRALARQRARVQRRGQRRVGAGVCGREAREPDAEELEAGAPARCRM